MLEFFVKGLRTIISIAKSPLFMVSAGSLLGIVYYMLLNKLDNQKEKRFTHAINSTLIPINLGLLNIIVGYWSFAVFAAYIVAALSTIILMKNSVNDSYKAFAYRTFLKNVFKILALSSLLAVYTCINMLYPDVAVIGMVGTILCTFVVVMLIISPTLTFVHDLATYIAADRRYLTSKVVRASVNRKRRTSDEDDDY